MKYTYPKPQDLGYHWNMLQRINYEIGVEPGMSNIGEEITLEFPNELTEEEKTTLDAIMADNPGYPPTANGTLFDIVDLWEEIELIRQTVFNAIGVQFKLFYNKSTGSNKFNRIRIIFERELTPEEKITVQGLHSQLMWEVV